MSLLQTKLIVSDVSMKCKESHYYLMNLTYINTSNSIVTIFVSNIAFCSYIPFSGIVWEDKNHPKFCVYLG